MLFCLVKFDNITEYTKFMDFTNYIKILMAFMDSIIDNIHLWSPQKP